MSPQRCIYVGVDTTSSQRPFCYVAIDEERQAVAIGQGKLKDLLAYLAGLSTARVALNGPAGAAGSSAEPAGEESALFPMTGGRQAVMRTAEAQLLEEKAVIEPTPAEESLCPGWMQRGFALWKALDGWGFERYPAGQGQRMTIETRAEAGFAMMLGHGLYPAGSLEGRMQRQMALYQQELPVPDPMDVVEEITPHRLLHGKLPLEKIYPGVELNAWLAAWTAWLSAHKPGRTRCWGTVEDGVIVLPGRNPN